MGNRQGALVIPGGTAVRVPLSEGFLAAVPNVNRPGVVLYSEPGMKGVAQYLPPGRYPNLAAYHFARRAQSISIGPNTKVAIFTAPNFGDINTKYANHDQAPFGIADLTLFSHAISSLIVA